MATGQGGGEWASWTDSNHPSDDEVRASAAFKSEAALVMAYNTGLIEHSLWRVLKAYKTDEAFRARVAASLPSSHVESQDAIED
jgi:hypothetical protein